MLGLWIGWSGAWAQSDGEAVDGGAVAVVDAPAEVPPAATLGSYRLGVRDLVHIEVVGEPTMTRDLEVRPDGSVDVPLGGAVVVRDLSLAEATEAVRTRLQDGYFLSPQVLLNVKAYLSQPVQVHGAVTKPGTYFLEGPTRLSEIIARAGSVKDKAAVTHANIVRQEGGVLTTLQVNLDKVFDGDATEQDVFLRAGDVVRVPEEESVFVQGEVKNNGLVAFRDGMTVSEAVSAAGGALATARLAEVYVLRRGERIALNLKKVLEGKEADMTIEPGDQIVVPVSAF